VLTQNLGEMDSIYCVHKKKKKFIAFIYIFVLTQNFGEMDSIYCVHKKKKESIGFIY
jgi:hypothetical protein